jgi:hypothetical protein
MKVNKMANKSPNMITNGKATPETLAVHSANKGNKTKAHGIMATADSIIKSYISSCCLAVSRIAKYK